MAPRTEEELLSYGVMDPAMVDVSPMHVAVSVTSETSNPNLDKSGRAITNRVTGTSPLPGPRPATHGPVLRGLLACGPSRAPSYHPPRETPSPQGPRTHPGGSQRGGPQDPSSRWCRDCSTHLSPRQEAEGRKPVGGHVPRGWVEHGRPQRRGDELPSL